MKKLNHILAIATCFALSLSVSSTFARNTETFKPPKDEVSKIDSLSTVCPVSFSEVDFVNVDNIVVYAQPTFVFGIKTWVISYVNVSVFAKPNYLEGNYFSLTSNIHKYNYLPENKITKPNYLEGNYFSSISDKSKYNYLPETKKIYLKNCSIRQC